MTVTAPTQQAPPAPPVVETSAPPITPPVVESPPKKTQPRRTFANSWMTGAELEEASKPPSFLIDRVLVEGQNCTVGGAYKVLKSTTLVDLTISLATGKPFLNYFDVLQTRRVGMVATEGGVDPLHDRAARIAAQKGYRIRDVNATWNELPFQFHRSEDLKMLEQCILDEGLQVIILDPAYKFMTEADQANLFRMGGLLEDVTRACEDHNCTIIISHHTKKSATGRTTLADLVGAGFDAFTRQWMLLSRTKAYKPGSFEHSMLIETGGAGFGGEWAYNAVELPEWRPRVQAWDEHQRNTKPKSKTTREDKAQADMNAIAALVKDTPKKTTNYYSKASGLSPRRTRDALAALEGGRVKKIQIKENGRKLNVWTIIQEQ